MPRTVVSHSSAASSSQMRGRDDNVVCPKAPQNGSQDASGTMSEVPMSLNLVPDKVATSKARMPGHLLSDPKRQ